MKNNHREIGIYLFLYLCLFALPAYANLLSVAKIPASGGYMIFELYDEPPLIAECRGMNASGVLAKLEKGDVKIGYGSGCWTADIDGYIHLFIKSFEDGIVRDSKLHNSNFIPQTSIKEDSSPEIQQRKELSLMAIRDDDPFIVKWEQTSPIYSVLDNCKILDKVPVFKGEKSSYEFASMDQSNDIFIYRLIKNKANWSGIFTTSDQHCQEVIYALKNASAVGVNTKDTIRFGLAVSDLTPLLKKKIKSGALIFDVFKSSAALSAGVKINDVLIAVNDEPVKNAKEALIAMRGLPKETKASILTVIRQGRKIKLEVTF